MEKKTRVRLLEQAENQKTKVLYEEVFSEDSVSFVDYYYQYKANKNKIYVVESEEEICSMLHLNPYEVCLGEQMTKSFYIVAVATKEKNRHQGMMRRLLKTSLCELRKEQIPFVFLMPAAEAIYKPFDFHFIYEQTRASFHPKDVKQTTTLFSQPLKEKDLEELEIFARNYWKDEANAYAIHTREYFQTLMAEQNCQNGQVFIIWQGEEIKGYFFTAKENGLEIREPVITKGQEKELLPVIAKEFPGEDIIRLAGFSRDVIQEEQRVPIIMARITCLETFVSGLRAKEKVCIHLKIRDELIEENSGSYELIIDENTSSIQKISGDPEVSSVGIGELTAFLFGYLPAKEAGLSQKEEDTFKKVFIYTPVSFNEVV